MPAKTLTGRVPADCIRRLKLPRLAPALLEQLRGLEDLTGTLSDAMDDLGCLRASCGPPCLGDESWAKP